MDAEPASKSTRPVRLGCVSFLNARPLIHDAEAIGKVVVREAVPSGLIGELEAGRVDMALCPVIDYQRSALPLTIVPCGGIGCDGPTLTVRLYSRIPLDRIDTIHADTDSHTSVALAQVVVHGQWGRRPRMVDLRPDQVGSAIADRTDTLLLIGDKVITAAPPEADYPHQLDLGQAWKGLTGLPFVFAVWMAPVDAALGEVPKRLDALRRTNAARIDALVDRYAEAVGWPADLALDYLGHKLRYAVGPREIDAIERFYLAAQALGLIGPVRPLIVRQS